MSAESRPDKPRAGARGTLKDESKRNMALGELVGSLGLLARSRGSVPCLETGADAWTDDDEDVQRVAARACAGCVGLTACGTYVKDFPEPAGVWAGTTDKQRREAKRK